MTAMPQFRLVHLIYLVSLSAVSLATFGAGGLIPWVILSLFWGAVFTSSSRRRALRFYLIPLILACGVVGLLSPIIRRDGRTAYRYNCQGNMKFIAMALLNYHDVYNCFPPAYVADKNGKPMHSWRVLILPYLEEQKLYNAYNFNEPWDGPNNGKLLTNAPSALRCPLQVHQSPTPAACTEYFAVVGPSAAWPGSVGRRLSDFPGAESTTILVFEATGQNIQWTEPRDLTIEEARQLITSADPDQPGGHRSERFFDEDEFASRHVALMDAAVWPVSDSVPANVWSQLLTIDDYAKPPREMLFQAIDMPHRLKVWTCSRLCLWIVLVLFPLPWAIRERGERKEHVLARPSTAC